ncbi:Fcf2 pre-rRNA processing protein [Besnoitia besnoiti]|uniref:Fcf2 pre-rRNA processing protein n=1 Tax=Besnoitia besnoiti TaxID=94643 RepID=A0A2A9M566_BESBE|nr:Fcf2 pre-rRNA processing protein [Besnoitia besnoiti]PFH32344.1 Fcf2 pre-rRNA processing protein [Besnoitia besnoiti]
MRTAGRGPRLPRPGAKKGGEERRNKIGMKPPPHGDRRSRVEAASRLLPPPPDAGYDSMSSDAAPSSSLSSTSLADSVSASSRPSVRALTSLTLLACESMQGRVPSAASSRARATGADASLEHLDPDIDRRLLCFSSQRLKTGRRAPASASQQEGVDAEATASGDDAGQDGSQEESRMCDLPRLDLTSAPGHFAFHRLNVDYNAAASVTQSAKAMREKRSQPAVAMGVYTPQVTASTSAARGTGAKGKGVAHAAADGVTFGSASSRLLPPTVTQNSEFSTLVDAGQLQHQERMAKRAASKAHLASWYEIPAQELSPTLRRELKVLELRGHMDPKKFHKEGLKIKSERTERRVGSGVYVQHTAHLHVCNVKDGFGSGGGVGAGRESEAVGCTKRRKGKGGSLLSSLLKDASVETWTRKKVRDLGIAKFQSKGRKNSWKTLKKKR